MNTIALIFSVFILTLLIGNIIGSCCILMLIFRCRRPLRKNIPVVLTCNAFISILIQSLSLMASYTTTAYGDFNKNISMNSLWCFIQFYVLLFTSSSVNYSYCTQAFFRLFRVVFFRRKVLQTFHFTLLMILIQWIVGLISIFPTIFSNIVDYVSDLSICLIPYDNIVGYVMLFSMLYFLPIIIVMLIYLSIVQYIRRTIITEQRRQRANRRDATILRRIIIVYFASLMAGLPTIIVLIIYWITRNSFFYTNRIQVLCLGLSLILETSALAITTPSIRSLLIRNRVTIDPSRIT